MLYHLSSHPSQIPGFVGTPDWNIHNHSIDRPSGPPQWYQNYQLLDSRWQVDHVVMMVGAESFGPTIQSFAQWLFTVCAITDPSLESMRVALTQLFELTGRASVIPFEAAAVYSETRLST